MDSIANASLSRREDGVSGSSVLIILPVLNEVDNIVSLIEGIRWSLVDVGYTVCIIDDGSTDGTVDVLRRLEAQDARIHVVHRKKTSRGSQRGSALQVGLHWGLVCTNRTLFVEMDGDLSHRPEELSLGISLVQQGVSDVVVASKYVPGGRTMNRPFTRKLVSLVGNTVIRLMISRRLQDYSNGYRFYTRRAAQLLWSHRLRYGSPIYLTEVLAVWLRSGLRIREFPSLYIGRNEGLSKLRYIDLLKASLAIFEIAWRYHVTGFEKKPPRQVVEEDLGRIEPTAVQSQASPLSSDQRSP